MPKPTQNQDQDQAQGNLQGQLQGQANLQGQLQGQANLQGQGQGQGQGQSEAQTAAQSLYSSSDNLNGNGNGNLNGNGNWNGNGNENGNDNSNSNGNDNTNHNTDTNSLSNSLSNSDANHLDNSIQNTVDNHVNVCVNVDLNLDANSLSHPVIDLHDLSAHDSLVMPQVVNQTMDGAGNMFNIDQVNNLIQHNDVSDPSVSFGGSPGDYCDPSGASFHMDAHDVHGGAITAGNMGNLDHSSTGINDGASVTQSAFNQTITLGANIQFNSQSITAGHDNFTDDHHTG